MGIGAQRLGGLLAVVLGVGTLVAACGEPLREADYAAIREDPLPEAQAFALTYATLAEMLKELEEVRRDAQGEANAVRQELEPLLAEVASFEQLVAEADAAARRKLEQHAQYLARIDAVQAFIAQGQELLPRWDEVSRQLNREQANEGLRAAHFAANTAAGKVRAETQQYLQRIESWQPPKFDNEEALRKAFNNVTQRLQRS